MRRLRQRRLFLLLHRVVVEVLEVVDVVVGDDRAQMATRALRHTAGFIHFYRIRLVGEALHHHTGSVPFQRVIAMSIG